MTLDLFAAPLARLMEAGASLAEVAAALGCPMAEISSTGQILTLRAGDLRRVLVYRVGDPPAVWMVMIPEDEDGRAGRELGRCWQRRERPEQHKPHRRARGPGGDRRMAGSKAGGEQAGAGVEDARHSRMILRRKDDPPTRPSE